LAQKLRREFFRVASHFGHLLRQTPQQLPEPIVFNSLAAAAAFARVVSLCERSMHGPSAHLNEPASVRKNAFKIGRRQRSWVVFPSIRKFYDRAPTEGI
jgi:hypothetical protein